MLDEMILDDAQEEAVTAMVNEKSRAVLNGSDMGTGKTVMSVEVVKRLGAKQVLLIAPINTHGTPEEGWEGAFARQRSELEFRRINSSVKGKEAHAAYQWGEPGVYAVGPELYAKMAFERKVKTVGRGKDKKPVLDAKGKPKTERVRTDAWQNVPDVAMFDEVHRAQNNESLTFKALVNQEAKFKMGMSGTPTGNSFKGAWAVAYWLWPKLIEPSHPMWVKIWCETKFNPFGTDEVVGEKEPGAFFKTLPCYVRLEGTGLPPVNMVTIDLPKDQRKFYDTLRDNMVAWIGDNPLVVDAPITLRARLRAVTLGIPTVSYDEPEIPGGKPLMNVDFAEDSPSAKLEKGFEVLDKRFKGRPALIGLDSQKFVKAVVHQLNERYGEGSAREWSGQVSQVQRARIKQDFIDGKFRYLVAVIPAMAEGVDGLQKVSRDILLLSLSDQRVLVSQFIARLARRGQRMIVVDGVEKFDVDVVYIAAKGTYDFGQLDKQLTRALSMNRSLLAKQRREAKATKVEFDKERNAA
ncbi:helicase [Clavibacter phage CN1A]|uniref:Helicase n=2 Tax=Viruses TaxID=10239 RepID=U5PXE8_9CAUD|nr:helicase [Clavibacter phage CN1A]AGY47123.1 helicase [Clavibacter phage CN1A]